MTGAQLVGTVRTNNENARAALAAAPQCSNSTFCSEHPYRALANEYGLNNFAAIADFLGNGLVSEIKTAVADGMRDCHDKILKPEVALAVADAMKSFDPTSGKTYPKLKIGPLEVSGLQTQHVVRIVEFALVVLLAGGYLASFLRDHRVDAARVIRDTATEVFRGGE